MTFPVWLVRLFPYLAGAAALALAVWYIDHRGYKRAEADALARQLEQDNLRAELALELAELVRQSEVRMQDLLTDSDRQLVQRIAELDSVNKTIIQPTLVKEIQNDPRLSDPASGITDSMRQSINHARSLSQYPCAAGADGDDCRAVSAFEPAD